MIPKNLKLEVESADVKQLLELLGKNEHNSPIWRFIFDEIQRRQLLKIGKTPWHHYLFGIASIIGAVAAIAAAYISFLQYESSCKHLNTPQKKVIELKSLEK